MDQYSNQASKILYVIFYEKNLHEEWKLVFLRHNTFIHLCLQLILFKTFRRATDQIRKGSSYRSKCAWIHLKKYI